MAEVEEVRLRERLRTAIDRAADLSSRARAAAAAAADEAQRTLEARQKCASALAQLAELPQMPSELSGEASGEAEETLGEEIEMLRQRLHAAIALRKRVAAEREQLLHLLAVYGEDGAAARRLTAEEQKGMVQRLTKPKEAQQEEPRTPPVPKKLGPTGWVPREIKPLSRKEYVQRMYEQPRVRQAQKEELEKQEQEKAAHQKKLLQQQELAEMLQRLYRKNAAAAAEAAAPAAPHGPLRHKDGTPMMRPDWCWLRKQPAPGVQEGEAAGEYAEIKLPHGYRAGDAVEVCTQDGRQLKVDVPKGVKPGDTFVALIPFELC
ncbi:hypothetical protein AB1Y20_004695 [Prymnesium parvum]|uniref:Uncharacterized protein n=1 Tax=Prymnesium parvum TaxID=97485 RepID=A0AB34IZU4_PRYPA